MPLTPLSAIWTTNEQANIAGTSTWPSAKAIYTFTDATIYPNISGKDGPTLAQIVAGTTSTGDVTWKNNTTYFNATSGIISWKVPVSGTYRIEVWGARGGNAAGNSYWGGYGARMRGDFALTGGDTIKMLVGQSGGQSYGGGGGGTFVATSSNTPLIVAGGGNTTSPWSGTSINAVTTTSGTTGADGTAGGSSGGAGTSTSCMYAGAGFSGNPTSSSCATQTSPLSFTNGGTGGTSCNSIGGFGGGSASDGCCCGVSGAGGGYSGGGSSSSSYGGAGGSYNAGTNQSNDAGGTGTATLSGNSGKIIITKL